MPYKNNKTTNYAGISFKKNAYEITIGIQGKQIYLGRTKNLKEAINIRKQAIKKYHTPLLENNIKVNHKKKIKNNYLLEEEN